ncbi:MAG: tetraacyldisaccharide 4'-kinase [Planctomycetota bacterium]|jgi:tetraacyldisaccharide 4'-kinase|nr:tetraacyldisaccharide 4'-kinase [Planctomycetota bacterium]MDP6942125.1 tetraacyldisaccharide 4'-kinase [Planctomycetota bacterium]
MIRFLFFPLACLFEWATRLRAWGYQVGFLKSIRPKFPTMSIGNIRAGGTGKTPLLFHTLDWFHEHQLMPGVLSRGYGGDEGRMLEERSPLTLLEEDSDRVRGLQRLLEKGKPEVLILDDGFQHLRIQRDLDIVLLDATRPFGACFPTGVFRESARALRRADLVVVSRAEMVGQEDLNSIWNKVSEVRGNLPLLPRVEGGVQISKVTNLSYNEELPLEKLDGRSVLLACGIGNPFSFQALCEAHGVQVEATSFLRDHSEWPEKAIREFSNYPCVLVTEKDAVKLRGRVPDHVFEVRVEWAFFRGKSDWVEVLENFVLSARAAKIEPLWQAHLEGSFS